MLHTAVLDMSDEVNLLRSENTMQQQQMPLLFLADGSRLAGIVHLVSKTSRLNNGRTVAMLVCKLACAGHYPKRYASMPGTPSAAGQRMCTRKAGAVPCKGGRTLDMLSMMREDLRLMAVVRSRRPRMSRGVMMHSSGDSTAYTANKGQHQVSTGLSRRQAFKHAKPPA